MDDAMDFMLLLEFGGQADLELTQEPEWETRETHSPHQGTLTQPSMLFNSEDEMLRAFEMERLEQALEEKERLEEMNHE